MAMRLPFGWKIEYDPEGNLVFIHDLDQISTNIHPNIVHIRNLFQLILEGQDEDLLAAKRKRAEKKAKEEELKKSESKRERRARRRKEKSKTVYSLNNRASTQVQRRISPAKTFPSSTKKDKNQNPGSKITKTQRMKRGFKKCNFRFLVSEIW